MIKANIEHIAIWVRDLEKMRAFYCKYFEGMTRDKYVSKNNVGFESYFVHFGMGCRLELMYKADIPESHHEILKEYIGLTHFALKVGSRENVENLILRLESDGYEILGRPRLTGDGFYEAIILDPEGNRVEIMS
ncbi:VOC family protein [Sediminitomix flava]|uniref:Lactoylglutathione lyase n=1 Tax=Sediminitomix flava TaxID=379075 RepID=A0A315ZF57_SEDFL|nr:VOC family protein [Sediminitomix flava]PWJ43374.1 lactoylglutathione lyase [Sediminitomix flava]